MGGKAFEVVTWRAISEGGMEDSPILVSGRDGTWALGGLAHPTSNLLKLGHPAVSNEVLYCNSINSNQTFQRKEQPVSPTSTFLQHVLLHRLLSVMT